MFLYKVSKDNNYNVTEKGSTFTKDTKAKWFYIYKGHQGKVVLHLQRTPRQSGFEVSLL